MCFLLWAFPALGRWWVSGRWMLVVSVRSLVGWWRLEIGWWSGLLLLVVGGCWWLVGGGLVVGCFVVVASIFIIIIFIIIIIGIILPIIITLICHSVAINQDLTQQSRT